MLQAIKSNKKTTIWGILGVVSEILRNNSSLVDFLPDQVKQYVLGFSSVICAVMAFYHTQDKLSPAEQEVKELKKAVDRETLKTEIKEETAVLVKDAKALVDAKIEPIMQVLPVVASVLPTITPPSPLVVDSIQTESITTNEINKEAEVTPPKAAIVEENQVVEIPKI